MTIAMGFAPQTQTETFVSPRVLFQSSFTGSSQLVRSSGGYWSGEFTPPPASADSEQAAAQRAFLAGVMNPSGDGTFWIELRGRQRCVTAREFLSARRGGGRNVLSLLGNPRSPISVGEALQVRLSANLEVSMVFLVASVDGSEVSLTHPLPVEFDDHHLSVVRGCVSVRAFVVSEDALGSLIDDPHWFVPNVIQWQEATGVILQDAADTDPDDMPYAAYYIGTESGLPLTTEGGSHLLLESAPTS